MSQAEVYLDTLQPFDVRVGDGELGLGGELGYEGKVVSVAGLSRAR